MLYFFAFSRSETFLRCIKSIFETNGASSECVVVNCANSTRIRASCGVRLVVTCFGIGDRR